MANLKENPTAIAGIVAGILILACIACTAFYLCKKGSRGNKHKAPISHQNGNNIDEQKPHVFNNETTENNQIELLLHEFNMKDTADTREIYNNLNLFEEELNILNDALNTPGARQTKEQLTLEFGYIANNHKLEIESAVKKMKSHDQSFPYIYKTSGENEYKLIVLIDEEHKDNQKLIGKNLLETKNNLINDLKKRIKCAKNCIQSVRANTPLPTQSPQEHEFFFKGELDDTRITCKEKGQKGKILASALQTSIVSKFHDRCCKEINYARGIVAKDQDKSQNNFCVELFNDQGEHFHNIIDISHDQLLEVIKECEKEEKGFTIDGSMVTQQTTKNKFTL